MTDTKLPNTGGGAAAPSPGTPRPKRRGHARYFIGALVCLAVVVWMFTQLRSAFVYLRPVSYAVAHRTEQGTRSFRMAGTVVPGSIHSARDGATFEVTEGGATAHVDYTGGPRDLFRNCAPVVVQGHWDGTVFQADQLLIRHGSDYDASKRVDAGCKAGSSS
jgi:cytochrome c-type biogenesis protein CcmE